MSEMDTTEARKARGAFFTPPAIAAFLAEWAVSDDQDARVLDPTCGEAAFLLAAGRYLRDAGSAPDTLDTKLFGVDIHEASLAGAMEMLEADGLDAHLTQANFFDLPTPEELGCPLPQMDAVIGNPPFIRYQLHTGEARTKSARAALRQGVRLSGLASSWPSLLVHACAFLKPEGRLAMVLPAELLSVHYAEPVRRWLRQRFAAVNLVLFERLQFEDAIERVVLVLARGTGGCDAFSLYHVNDADDLARIRPFDEFAVTFTDEGKWTDLLLPIEQRQLFRRVSEERFVQLGDYAAPELGTVTGANHFFALSETTRVEYGLDEAKDVFPISPPGTKHLRGSAFTKSDWKKLLADDERVWLLQPDADRKTASLRRYLRSGTDKGVETAYKCRVRDPWWRPPMVSPPDLFFTYMSHRYPRLIANQARVSFVNSMHGLRLVENKQLAKSALPLLALNSLTILGAEIHGRSYGGGILKMEPREAAALPVPSPADLQSAWAIIKEERSQLDRRLRDGRWTSVLARIDEVLLSMTLKLQPAEVEALHEAARSLRERRLRAS